MIFSAHHSSHFRSSALHWEQYSEEECVPAPPAWSREGVYSERGDGALHAQQKLLPLLVQHHRWAAKCPPASKPDSVNFIFMLMMRRLPADWSTCQLSDRAVCGNGIKTRMLDCVRSDGKSVDLRFCAEVGYVGFSPESTVDFFFENDEWSNTPFSPPAGPGPEVADECVLCCRMSCKLPAVWLVCVVRVYTHLWTGRYVWVSSASPEPLYIWMCVNSCGHTVSLSLPLALTPGIKRDHLKNTI